MEDLKNKYPINTFSEQTQRKIIELVEFEKFKIKADISKEIADAHCNGESTSRLTRLFNNI